MTFLPVGVKVRIPMGWRPKLRVTRAPPGTGDDMETPTNNGAGRALALVTGASSGIGRELAKQFAEHDFDLVIAAEDDAIADAASELEQLGARVEPVQV